MIFPIVGWGIQLVEDTPFSHYAIQFGGFVIDSSSKGVRVANVLDFYSRYHVQSQKRVEIEIVSYYEIFDWIQPFLLQHYGYFQNFAILLKRLRLTEKVFANSGMTCSELVARFLTKFKPEFYIDSVNTGLIELEEALERI
jgi:hypothetical protein